MRKAYSNLALCCAGMLVLGMLYAWSILKTPFSSQFHWTESLLSMNYTISICMLCAGNMLSGYLQRRISIRSLLLISAAMCLSGLMFSSIAQVHTPAFMIVGYGVLFGCGAGVGYNTLLATGNAWFPNRRGMSSGVMTMCFGLSTMLLGKLAAFMMGHSSIGWRSTYRLMGMLIAVVMILCAFLIHWPVVASGKKAKDNENDQHSFTPNEMLHSRCFWLFYIYGILAASVGSAAIDFSRDLMLSLGSTVSLAVTMVGVLSIFSGVGRIVSGLMFDRFGDHITMRSVSLVATGSALLMMIAVCLNWLPGGILGLMGAGFSHGCCATISSAYISSKFGPEYFAINYSYSNSKILFSSLTAPLCSILLECSGSYVSSFAMLSVFAALSLLILHYIDGSMNLRKQEG